MVYLGMYTVYESNWMYRIVMQCMTRSACAYCSQYSQSFTRGCCLYAFDLSKKRPSRGVLRGNLTVLSIFSLVLANQMKTAYVLVEAMKDMSIRWHYPRKYMPEMISAARGMLWPDCWDNLTIAAFVRMQEYGMSRAHTLIAMENSREFSQRLYSSSCWWILTHLKIFYRQLLCNEELLEIGMQRDERLRRLWSESVEDTSCGSLST